MELHQLFKIQNIIEGNIRSYTDIKEDHLGEENIFDLRFLALQVKTAEIANLTKCYKYSKVKPHIPQDKLFARFLDSMGFLLSIGNVHEFNIIDLEAINGMEKEDSIIRIFSFIFDDLTALRHSLQHQKDYYTSLSIYIRIFARYLNLAEQLNITFEEIFDYYLRKHNIEEALSS